VLPACRYLLHEHYYEPRSSRMVGARDGCCELAGRHSSHATAATTDVCYNLHAFITCGAASATYFCMIFFARTAWTPHSAARWRACPTPHLFLASPRQRVVCPLRPLCNTVSTTYVGCRRVSLCMVQRCINRGLLQTHCGTGERKPDSRLING